MMAYPILIFMQSFDKFQILDPKIQMKRAKRLILAFLHTYLLTYLLTTLVIESAIILKFSFYESTLFNSDKLCEFSKSNLRILG